MSDVPDGLRQALSDRYAIERELGQGGMATVYLARDVRHDRHVALKVLKPELGAVVGSERFLAEIRTTANLQHPHILALFDSGEVDGHLFYVMPHIEGESLRDRLDREKQLSIAEAVDITEKVADALDYAHEHGVVHRDIKPANILVTERGEPLVADFGIALAVSEAGGGRITETGLSLGTPHYMSPEQATGDRDIDPRSDIYALGCVLYEMLAGQPPFAAPTAQGVLVRILTEHPRSITDFRHTVPPHVAGVLARSLEKLPADRFPNAKEFKAALADESYRYQAVPQPTTPATAPQPIESGAPIAGPALRKQNTPFIAAATVAVIAMAAAAAGWFRSPAERPIVRSTLDLGGLEIPGGAGGAGDVAISPDGSRLAVSLTAEGTAALFIRKTDEPDFRQLAGTEGASQGATFSPDGLWLAFLRDRELFKISVDGGAPQPLLAASQGLNVAFPYWSDDGWIYFTSSTGIFRVRQTGGNAEEIVETGSFAFNPRPLPGGSAILFNDPNLGVVVADVETDSIRTLLPGALDATYIAATGHLLWVDEAAVMWAAPFDPKRAELTGDPSFVLDDVTRFGTLFARYSVSDAGTIVYGSGGGGGGPGANLELVIVGPGETQEVIELAPRTFSAPRWSPDGRRIAYSATTPDAGADAQPDIYVYDVEFETAPARLTNTGTNRLPVWSPDGSRIVFSSVREGTQGLDLFIREVDTDRPPELLLSLPGRQAVTDWPSDDVFVMENPSNPSGISVVELGDSATVREYYAPESDVDEARVSPDGSLAAYHSDESGQDEVYIRSFPEPRAATVVSEGGGRFPRWSPNGNTLYYRSLGGDSIYAAVIRREPTPAILSRKPVMAWPYASAPEPHPDGARFITRRRVSGGADSTGEPEVERHFIVTNWFRELRERTGGSGGDGR